MDPNQNESMNSTINIKDDLLIPLFNWLDGKKTYLFGILSLTFAFLGLKEVIDQDTQSYLQAVLALIAGGAQYSTVKLGARR